MSAVQEKPGQKYAELSTAEKVIEFIQKNRRIIFGGLLVIVVGIVGAVIGLTVQERLRLEAFTRVDEFQQRYEALHEDIAHADEHEDSDQAAVDALLADLAAFAARNSGTAARRAFSISASIYWQQERWLEAEKAWMAAAEAAPQTYFAPIALWNAAVEAEEQGNLESAIALYTRVAQEHEEVFFIAARSQFSVGRLEEARDNSEAALEAYRNLLSRWPLESEWANLAQSRVLLLSD